MISRNSEINNYSLPNLTYQRSGHHWQKNHKTTMNTGFLTPIYCNELLQPGDTMKMALSLVVRMNTPFQPVMDNCYLDTYAFKIDWIDLWKYTKEFFGENTEGAWAQTTEYITPRIAWTAGTRFDAHSVLAYLGYTQRQLTTAGQCGGGLSLNAYNLTYNEWFRDQNYIPPLKVNYEGTTVTYDFGSSVTGGMLQKVAKLHDRFTSGLPEPQKGDALAIPVGTTAPIYGPVVGTGYSVGLMPGTDGTTPGATMTGLLTGSNSGIYFGKGNPAGANNASYLKFPEGVNSDNNAYSGLEIMPGKGYADLSAAVGATLNAQRTVVAAQHILEGMAIYGSRYREIIKGMWGVETSDKSQHIPEYLGGRRTPVSISQITQTSAGAGNIGDTGAMSITTDIYDIFTKSFDQHAVVLILACIRTDQHYGQGIPRQYLKERRLDYYWNELAHISFQPVYTGEIWFTGNMSEAMSALAFLPAFNEYRGEVDQLTGMFNPEYRDGNLENTWLKEWTYGNKFDNQPVMGKEFIEETVANVDRTLTVQSTLADQFICDFQFFIDLYSEVPAKGYPGLNKF